MQQINSSQNLEVDLYRKRAEFEKFRQEVETDLQMNQHAFYIPPQFSPVEKRIVGWPTDGGPKHRYWVRDMPGGKMHLAHKLNAEQINYEQRAGGRARHAMEVKGYREVTGQELLDIVDKQQAEALEKIERDIELAKEREDAPAAVRVVTGGRRGRKAAENGI